MTDTRCWRLARFESAAACRDFIDHMRSLAIAGIELETLHDNLRVRFSAPAEVEVGLAGMVSAHGGHMMPQPRATAPA